MCLAVPGKITELREESGVPMARVDFGGMAREACMVYLPEAGVGEYVLVHVGFAITTGGRGRGRQDPGGRLKN